MTRMQELCRAAGTEGAVLLKMQTRHCRSKKGRSCLFSGGYSSITIKAEPVPEVW